MKTIIKRGENVMESLNKLEATAASWYKDIPHLPTQVRKWLAENAWWLVLIGVIIGTIGIIGLVSVTFLAGAVLVGVAGAAGAALGGLALIAVLASLVFSVITVVVSSLAINPLKAHDKKGWSLLFLTVLIGVASMAVTFLLNYNLLALIWGLIPAAIAGYFLFEIREYYGTHRSAQKVAERKNA